VQMKAEGELNDMNVQVKHNHMQLSCWNSGTTNGILHVLCFATEEEEEEEVVEVEEVEAKRQRMKEEMFLLINAPRHQYQYILERLQDVLY